MKEFLKYILIFILSTGILILLLVITALIPQEKIKENIEKSAIYLDYGTVYVNEDYSFTYEDYPLTWLDIYADEKIINIIYNIDNENILESVLVAKYCDQGIGTQLQESYTANQEYMRYWHGSMIFIRPLLVFMDIYGIYLVDTIIMLILVIILLIILFRKKQKAVAISFIIAFLMTGSVFSTFCLSSTWTYLIMLVISIIGVLIEKSGNKKLYVLFFISGILTCFFDFLSTETITILVPLTLILGIRHKEKRMKERELTFVIKSIIIWFIAYCGMWIAKWVIASIVLNINALDYVIKYALVRINGETYVSTSMMYKEVILKNVFALFPFNLIKNKYIILPLVIATIILAILYKKDKKELKLITPFLVIAVIPYIRYLVLTNHSWLHYYQTARAQFSTIICIILMFIYGVDKNKIKGEKNEETNDINTSTK